MIHYLVPLAIFYFGIALCATYGGTSRAVLLAAALPMVALVALRGHAGTDTAAYYAAFSGLETGVGYGSEPIFLALTGLLWSIWPDPRFVVNGISLLIALILLWALGGARYGAWFGGLLIVPGMFYELSMNVMRFGLAAALFLVATRVPAHERPWRYVVFTVLGAGMHYSSVLLFVLFPAVTRRGQGPVLTFGVLCACVAAFAMPAYFGDKTDLYAGMAAPNASSGLLFVLLQTAMLATLWRFRTEFAVPRAGFWLLAGLEAAFYGLTRVSYAGIRFQLLLTFLMAVVMLRQYRPANGRMSQALAVCLFLIGLVALAGRFNNMLDEAGRGASPFLPYRVLPALEAIYR
ncbi:EpsG family protein [Burkholderia sp. JKS000303]|uniref:EpsG family protein n=1 Tax=Burkholderia sp. JKS000303 TaxID=1938747 RepID=UPI000BF77A8B|nr:EpsG family protein [Burkholderia sp. JKS000303]PFH19521.1 EpsG-like putative glucosyltransferase [Burkholderia sp. JKS000303]